MKLNFSDFCFCFSFFFFVFTLSCRCLITLPSLLFMLNQTTGYSGRNTDWKLDLEDRYRLYWQLFLFTQSNLRFRVSLLPFLKEGELDPGWQRWKQSTFCCIVPEAIPRELWVCVWCMSRNECSYKNVFTFLDLSDMFSTKHYQSKKINVNSLTYAHAFTSKLLCVNKWGIESCAHITHHILMNKVCV